MGVGICLKLRLFAPVASGLAFSASALTAARSCFTLPIQRISPSMDPLLPTVTPHNAPSIA